MKLVVFACFGGAVVGVVEALASFALDLNLLLVFPALIGLVAGGVATAQIKKGKIRAPGSAALVACVAALLGQGIMHAAEYGLWRNQAVEEIGAEKARVLANEELTPEERQEIEAIDPGQQLDSDLEAEVGQGGFLGYMSLAAAAGVSIGRAGDGDEEGKPTLTGVGTWLLWGVEFLIAGLIGFVMAYNRARAPFCEICRAWYGRVDVIALGNGNKAKIKELTRAVDAADFGQLLDPETLGAPVKGVASLITLDRCATCEEHEPLLSIKQVRETRSKTQSVDKYKTLIRADEAREIEKIVQQREAEIEAERAKADADTA